MEAKLYEKGLDGTTTKGIERMVGHLILLRDYFKEYQRSRMKCEDLRTGYFGNNLTEQGLDKYNFSLAELSHNTNELKLRVKWFNKDIKNMLCFKKLNEELDEISGDNHDFTNYFLTKDV